MCMNLAILDSYCTIYIHVHVHLYMYYYICSEGYINNYSVYHLQIISTDGRKKSFHYTLNTPTPAPLIAFAIGSACTTHTVSALLLNECT